MDSSIISNALHITRCVRNLYYENSQTRERFCFNCFTSTAVGYSLADQRVHRHRVVFSTAIEVLTCIDCSTILTSIRSAIKCTTCFSTAIGFLNTRARSEAISIIENPAANAPAVMISCERFSVN
jgi:hypothetical protein